jgi:hypothetical protein
MKKMFIEGNQIHNFMLSSGSGTVINYGSGSGSDFLTSYGSGSGSTSQKVTVPTVPVPVPQHCSCSLDVLRVFLGLSKFQFWSKKYQFFTAVIFFLSQKHRIRIGF